MRHEKPSQFRVAVNGNNFDFGNAKTRGKDILSAAGFVPADEHVLIQLLTKSTRSIGLDEPVDLDKSAIAFQAFKSDRIFTLTIDGRGYEWGAPTISEPNLRSIAHVREDEVLILKKDDRECELGPDDEVSLDHRGTEQLRTVKRLVTVYFDGVEKRIPHGIYTTEQLIKVLGVAQGYVLNLVTDEGRLVTLQPGQKIQVKEDMRFFSQVPCGGFA